MFNAIQNIEFSEFVEPLEKQMTGISFVHWQNLSQTVLLCGLVFRATQAKKKKELADKKKQKAEAGKSEETEGKQDTTKEESSGDDAPKKATVQMDLSGEGGKEGGEEDDQPPAKKQKLLDAQSVSSDSMAPPCEV